MPKPRKDEGHKDFVDRCIPIVIKDGTAKDGSQGKAVCESMWKSARTAAAYRDITVLAGGTATIRTAQFQGRDHIVVPVIALLGDVVVFPVGADGPEFVPAAELAAAPQGWNGRPIFPDHPHQGRATANDPRTLEERSFGQMFATTYADGKLCAEAWLDPARAEAVGPDAVQVVDDLRVGKMVEVSVGAWITLERVAGEHDGKSYVGVWHDIVPDHLAVGLNGSAGACSVEMGCGALRVAVNVDKESNMPGTGTPKPTWLQRMLQRFTSTPRAAEVSDNELHSSLWSALRATVPAFDWVVDVFQADTAVIYSTCPDRDWHYWRRTFAVSDSGDVTLNDDAVEVQAVTRWEPVASPEPGDSEYVAASDHTKQPKAACRCQDQDKGGNMSKAREIAERLAANKATPFTPDSVPHLEALGETALIAMEAALSPAPVVEPPPAPAVAPPAVVEPVAQTEEQLLAALPESVRQLVSRAQAHENAYRARLVGLLGKAQTAFTEADLNASPTDQLTKLAGAFNIDVSGAIAQVRDFTAASAAVQVNNHGTKTLDPPSPYAAVLPAATGGSN